MTSLPPPRPVLLWQPRDYTVWDANRDRIYEYYLVEKNDLVETKRLMEERHSFPEYDKNMWEHVLLRHFGFRKNLSKSDWVPIGQHIAKRRRLGKDTYAIDLCGAQLPKRSVEKNIPQNIALDANSPMLPRDVLIRTPPPGEPSASQELQRRVNISDLLLASSPDTAAIKDMLPEWIIEVRKKSPFNQTMLRLQLCPKGAGIDPTFLWKSASRKRDISMMKILVQAGYKFADLPVTVQQDCLRRNLFREEQSDITCVSYLLESGVTSAPVLDNGVYWREPGRPILARDALWFHDGEPTMLFDEFYKRSSRGDETITVSGICRAASGGLDSLKHYMETTPCATVEIKTVLLEIALSESADKGCCDVLDCLLDYGIDPNVPSLGGNKYSGLESSPKSWNPTLRAIKKCNLEAVRKFLLRHPVLHCHDCFIGVLSQPGEDCWAATIKLLETSGLNPQRFGDDEVIQEVMSNWVWGNDVLIRLLKIFELYNIPFDKKVHGVTLLQMAIRKGCSLHIVEVLLRHGVDGGSELLYDALKSRSVYREEIVELLLDCDIDPSTGDANLLEAALSPGYDKGGNLRLYFSMLERGVRWTAKAPTCGTNLITLLLKNGAEDCLIADTVDAGYDLNLQGQHNRLTPLAAAINHGRFQLAVDFIRQGANINTMLILDSKDWDDGHGSTALHFACREGAPLSFIKTLIDLGAQVDAGSGTQSGTSLHNAVSAGHLNMTSLLIARGADINAVIKFAEDSFAVTPLDLAAEDGNLELCQLLYDLGGRSGSRAITDVDGAVQLARDQNNLGVLRFFEERVEGLDRIPDLEDED
ncbi:hypothetical protein PG996_009107 [Apiospora saccharicola]|uniref:Clr5 domain-containing protein n=1 Tax=Apiospora saccharicola TaxID=335842 RepID=A0ABR1UJS9_9PEZI